MNPQDIDLSKVYQHTIDALREYAPLLPGHVLELDQVTPFQLTPQKPNTARTTVPVRYQGTKIADMYVILFRHQDGTGDSSTYRLDDVVIPHFLSHSEKPERILPRAKTGVLAEGFFPLFSVQNGVTYPFICSLEELTIDVPTAMALGGLKPSVVQAWNLGMSAAHFRWHTTERDKGYKKVDPKVTFTVGNYHQVRFGDPHNVCNIDGKRFGDPHAIYAILNEPNVIQVAGFLAVTEKTPTLVDATRDWSLPFQQPFSFHQQ